MIVWRREDTKCEDNVWRKASMKVNFEVETIVNTLPPNMLHSCAGVLSWHIINLLSYIITSCMIIQLKAGSLVWYMNNESIALLWLLYNSLLLYMFVYIYTRTDTSETQPRRLFGNMEETWLLFFCPTGLSKHVRTTT